MEEGPGPEPKPSLTDRFNALDRPRLLTLLGVVTGLLAFAAVLIMTFGNATPMPSGA